MLAERIIHSIPQAAMEAYARPSVEIQGKLIPFMEDVGRVYSGVLHELEEYNKNRLNKIEEEDILDYLESPYSLTPRGKNSIHGRDLVRFSNQYDHVRKVMGASLELKRTLLELKAPERILAYQTGTGWPLPEENESCQEIAHLRYGEGPLAEFFPPGSEKDEKAGIHVYKIIGKNGQEATLLAVKGRMHGYTETDWETATLDLAFMPRVLKGIGTEFVLSSFASGADPYSVGKDWLGRWKVKKFDLGVLVGCTDQSGLSAKLGPGSGDQRLIGPVFGGAFKNIAAMTPEVEDVALLLETVNDLKKGEFAKSKIKPDVHQAFEVDTLRTPNFQAPYEHALPDVVLEQIKRFQTMPTKFSRLFRRKLLPIVHGMVQIPERDSYFASWSLGIRTLFNRRLRELPVVTFTDLVDPSDRGQSHAISDEAVREAGKVAEAVTSKIITTFFQRYADTPVS